MPMSVYTRDVCSLIFSTNVQDLGVVTREDLAELVGVTDRRHQIKARFTLVR